MKKFLLFLVALSACLTGMATQTLTVYDGTVTNNKVPIYGFYADGYLKCEYVIPAEQLTAMAGQDITEMKWYLEAPAESSWGGANFQIFMKEIAATTLDEFQGLDGATIVYEGAVDPTTSEILIEFTDAYNYGGGNLLIGVYNTVKGSYKGAYFYGETVEGACVQNYSYTSLDAVTAEQRDFIPKTTFTYGEKAPFDAKVTPDALNFGKLNPGQTATMSVTLKNRGVNAFTPAVSLAAPFSTDYVPAELASGAEVEIPVTFAPTQLGEYTGEMSIAYGGEAPITVALTGRAVSEVEFTVCDGTETNDYVPVYGYYFDTNNTLSQMIYPAELLADVVGQQITGIKFYPNAPLGLSGGQYALSLGVSADALYDCELSSDVPGNLVTELTTVATLSPVIGSDVLEFVFDEPFTYEGGNLAVQTLVTQSGNYVRTYFYGLYNDELTDFSSYCNWGYNGHIATSFLPKMSIVYSLAPADETVTVEGYVMDDEGAALEGVNVTLTVNAEVEGAPRTAAEPQTYTATTDETGAFAIELTPVEGATYTMTYAKEGYQTLTTDYNLGDEIRIYMQPDGLTGISTVKTDNSVVRYFDISGRYVGTSLDNAPAGLYIGSNGKKVIK